MREMERISGVSHTYLSSIEKGTDPRSGNEILPTPDTLMKLSKAYNYSYLKLMEVAGYINLPYGNQQKFNFETMDIVEMTDQEMIEASKITKHDIVKELLAIFKEYLTADRFDEMALKMEIEVVLEKFISLDRP